MLFIWNCHKTSKGRQKASSSCAHHIITHHLPPPTPHDTRSSKLRKKKNESGLCRNGKRPQNHMDGWNEWDAMRWVKGLEIRVRRIDFNATSCGSMTSPLQHVAATLSVLSPEYLTISAIARPCGGVFNLPTQCKKVKKKNTIKFVRIFATNKMAKQTANLCISERKKYLSFGSAYVLGLSHGQEMKLICFAGVPSTVFFSFFHQGVEEYQNNNKKKRYYTKPKLKETQATQAARLSLRVLQRLCLWQW